MAKCFGLAVFGLPPTPPRFLARAKANETHLYDEGYGIARNDIAVRNDTIAENFESMGHHVSRCFGFTKALAPSSIASIGLDLLDVILLLWKKSIDSIPQELMGAYMQVGKELLDFPDDHGVICGLAIGYRDEDAKVTSMRMPKDDWGDHGVFYDWSQTEVSEVLVQMSAGSRK